MDPFQYEVYVKVKMFGKVKKCKALATEHVTVDQIKTHIFEGTHEVLWIERGEELYGSPHFCNRSAVRVTRDDWLRGIGSV